MKRNKLIVLSVDALTEDDLSIAENLPGFSKVMAQRCGVSKVKSIYPTLTYPIHVVQITGQNTMDTGVYNNTIFQPGVANPDWCWTADLIKVPTIFSSAKKAGLSTCALMWPVLARADNIDINIPEIWVSDECEDSLLTFEKNSSAAGFEYFKKHRSRLRQNPVLPFDDLAVSAAEDIILSEMPDIMFIHLSAVDILKHRYGMDSVELNEAIAFVDKCICVILDAIGTAGYEKNTNFVICSDHGHLYVDRQVNLNVIFREEGLIAASENGTVFDYRACCQNAGLSAQIRLKNPLDSGTRDSVWILLNELKNNPDYGIRRIYTRKETEELYKLSGPFEFVVDGDGGVAFGDTCVGRAIRKPNDSDYTYAMTGHGHRPEIGPQPVFLAMGPDFSENNILPECSILDELPTYLTLLGLKMDNLKGHALMPLLKHTRSSPSWT